MRFLRASAICIIRALRPGRRRTAFVALPFALFAPRFLARAASDREADGWSALSGWPRRRGCIEIRSRFKGCEMPFRTGFTRTPCHEKKSDADSLGFAMPQTGLMPPSCDGRGFARRQERLRAARFALTDCLRTGLWWLRNGPRSARVWRHPGSGGPPMNRATLASMPCVCQCFKRAARP